MKAEWTSALLLMGALAVPATAFATAEKAADDVVKTEKKQKKLEVGSTVPERITLNDFAGNATSFKDLRGKVVVLHFWSYRCPAGLDATNSWFQAWTRSSAAKPPLVKARTRFSVADDW